MSVRKVTEEKAQAFRARVKEQNDRMARMVVIDIDDFIDYLETLGRALREVDHEESS